MRCSSMLLLAATSVAIALVAAPGARAQAWPDLTTDLPPQGGGERDAAVIVGVSDYVYLPGIDGAADNAAAWHQWLVRVRGVPQERVIILRDREATRERIMKALTTVGTEATKGGTVWFVFIGHGAPSPTGDDGLLLGADTDADADSLGARGLPQKDVLAALQAGAQANAVAVFDACFSGKTADGSAPLVKGLQATLPVRKAPAAAKVAVLASSETFAGPLPSGDKPAFSYLLLGALRGWADANDDKAVTTEEALRFARGALQAGFKTDTRLPSRRGPDHVLARNTREQGPDLAAILVGRCPARMGWDGHRCTADASRWVPAQDSAAKAPASTAAPALDGSYRAAGATVQIYRQPQGYGVVRTAAPAAPETGLVMEDGDLVIGVLGTGRFGTTLYAVEGPLIRTLKSFDTDGFYVEDAPGALVGPDGLNGTYTIQNGVFPNGVRYTGTVTIRPIGKDKYRLEWSVRDSKWTAVGLVVGNRLAVAWGTEGQGALLLYEKRGRNLEGRVARFDFSSGEVIREVLTR